MRTDSSKQEKMKRRDDEVLKEELNINSLRAHGESMCEMSKILLINRPVNNHENKMVDAIDSIERRRCRMNSENSEPSRLA